MLSDDPHYWWGYISTIGGFAGILVGAAIFLRMMLAYERERLLGGELDDAT